MEIKQQPFVQEYIHLLHQIVLQKLGRKKAWDKVFAFIGQES
jgi:hypothetical protein